MRETKKTNKIILIAALLFCAVLLLLQTGISGSILSAEAKQVVLGETGIEQEYGLGKEINIPKAQLSVDETTFFVLPAIHFPDGTALKREKVILNQLGRYLLIYSADVNGTTFSKTKEFYVYPYLAVNSATGQPLQYGQNTQYGAQGLQFSLKPSEKVEYNRIVDLSDKTAADTLISIDATPAVKGTAEARDLCVTLTDIYDASNYINIRVRRAPPTEDQNAAYVTAAHAGQPMSGWIEQLGMFFKDHANYGTGIYNGLRGDYGNTHHIEFYFDYADKTLYTSDSGIKRKVINFATDFEDNGWKGFTTGEVYLSVNADSYATANLLAPFSGIILSVYDHNLAAGADEQGNVGLLKIRDSVLPVPDFGGYGSADNVPYAMVGFPYKVFDAGFKPLYGEEKLSTRVYFGYNTSTRYELNVTGGSFIPKFDGIHTIVYTLTDRFGNKGYSYVDVYALKDTDEGIELAVHGYENHQNGIAGHRVEVPGTESVSILGSVGAAELSITARHNGAGIDIPIDGNSFVPELPGIWTITYLAVDYVGRTGQFEYQVSVDAGTEAVFEKINDFPKYLIVNADNPIPGANVTDYTGTAVIKKAAERIFAEKDGIELGDISQGHFTPTSEGTYTIVYVSTSSKGVKAYKRLNVVAVDVGFGDRTSFSLEKYFYSGGIAATSSDSGKVTLTMTENATAEFIRPVDAVDFNFTFNISDAIKASDSIAISLTDINNPGQTVKLKFSNKGGVRLTINDRHEYTPENLKYGGGPDFTVKMSAGKLSINSFNCAVNDYLDGSPFMGFDSLTAFLAITTQTSTGVSGNTDVLIKAIGNQSIYNVNRDRVEPKIILSNTIKGKYLPSDTVVISRAKALDVIDPYTDASLTVLGPDNNPVKDVNGITLQNVSLSQDYYLQNLAIGSYKVLYKYADGAGNGDLDGRGPLFEIVNRTPPVITLSKTSETVKKGANVSIATATVKGIDAQTNIQLFVFIQGPSGSMTAMPTDLAGKPVSSFAAAEKGVYTVRYMALDKWANMTIADFKVTVE